MAAGFLAELLIPSQTLVAKNACIISCPTPLLARLFIEYLFLKHTFASSSHPCPHHAQGSELVDDGGLEPHGTVPGQQDLRSWGVEGQHPTRAAAGKFQAVAADADVSTPKV